MKTASILSLVLATTALHAKGIVPSPTAEEPRARTGQQVKLGDVLVVAPRTMPQATTICLIEPFNVTSIRLDRDFRESPPGNLVRAELEAANGEND